MSKLFYFIVLSLIASQTSASELNQSVSMTAAVDPAAFSQKKSLRQTLADKYDYASTGISFEDKIKIWRKYANEDKNPSAQYNLGVMYYQGLGVAKDYKTAAKWFRSAAEQGDREAQYVLATLYLKGEGVKKNYQDALEWFQYAASQGVNAAYFELGKLYSQGIGVKKDYAKAFLNFALAASKGDRLASTERKNIEKAMSKTQYQQAMTLFYTHHKRIARRALSKKNQ